MLRGKVHSSLAGSKTQPGVRGQGVGGLGPPTPSQLHVSESSSSSIAYFYLSIFQQDPTGQTVPCSLTLFGTQDTFIALVANSS